MEVENRGKNRKQKRKFTPRIQKTRLAEIEENLKLLLAKGIVVKKTDASILATAPRELLRPITTEWYKSLASFEKAEFQHKCRKVVDGRVKIDGDKLRQVLFERDRVRLDKLQDFILRRRQQRAQVSEEHLSLDMKEPGALLRFGAIKDKRAKYAMTGNNTAYAYAAKIGGLENDLKTKKRKSSDNQTDSGEKKNKPLGLPDRIPPTVAPRIIQTISNSGKAESNIKIATTGLTTAYTYFLDKCKFRIGEKKKAVIKRRCDNEGFLVEVCGKICALHVSHLFAELDDFAEPLNWFNEGQELTVFIRDVLELEQCPFLTRVKGLSGNLIAATSLIPPDNWLMKIPNRFLVYKCHSDRESDDKMNVCLGPSLKGFIPYQNWDDKLLKYAAQLNDGSAINVYTFRLDRTLSKFTNFAASRVPKDECYKVEKGVVVPIVRINVTNFLLPCKSRFIGWKLLLPLTEADDNFSETNRQTTLVPKLALIMAIDEKKKTAIVSTRPSRLKLATRGSALFTLLPKSSPNIVDRGIVNARLLHDKKGTELRGFVVSKWDKNHVEVLLGMDYVWPLMGRLRDETGTLHKRLKHLSVVKVRIAEDKFENKTIPVDLADGSVNVTSGDEEEKEEDDDNRSTEQSLATSVRNSDADELEEQDGFNWEYDAQPNLGVLGQGKSTEDADPCSSSSDDDEIQLVVKKNKKEREEDRRRKEVAMREAEMGLLKPSDHSNMPKTAEEFDRLVTASPNNASLWIRYMAHHLQELETEKARQIAKRGLKVIFGNEADKLSLWQACLNLENMYGTQESLETVFKEALKQNDPLKIYSHLAKIYGLKEEHERARETYQTMLKKFKQNKEVWIEFGSWLFDIGSFNEARQLMKRSLNSLTEKEHVEVIVKFAQFEFTSGERDFGKSLMDNLLLSYPKRLDLWNVYIDQLIKLNDFDAVRMNFNKLLSARLALRRMKSVFKKWIDFESRHGTPERVEEVKRKVVDYVDLDRS